MSKQNIMLDLETLGTNPDAVVMSIGAVTFDEDGLGDDRFYAVLNIDDQLERGRKVLGDTILWWGTQPREVWKQATDRPILAHEALLSFGTWVRMNSPPKALMWGNGADFDNVILGDLHRTYEVKPPWSYSRNRCYRTLKDLVKLRAGQGRQRPEGTQHNALDDAVHQAEYAVQYLRNLREMQT